MFDFQRSATSHATPALERLHRLLGGRSESAAVGEPTEILITPPPQAVRPILKIAIFSILVTAGLVWLNNPKPLTEPEVKSPGIPVAVTSDSTAPNENFGTIVVDVKGYVFSPGLVTLPAGSRVADAIAAAGGATADANLVTLNLAERLADGQMIYIGDIHSQEVLSDPRINLNLATESELDSLPGVGPVMAGRIVAWRESNQRFHSVEELQEVPGIGPKMFANLKDLIRI